MGINTVASGSFALPTSTTNSLSGITGAATTYTATEFKYVINGRVYLKATDASAATPTTDSAGGNLVLASGYGTVIAWTVNTSGTVKIYRGETVKIDIYSPYDWSQAPEFPSTPGNEAVFAYTLHKNYSGSDFTIGTTNWNTASTAHTTVNVAYLPERPELS